MTLVLAQNEPTNGFRIGLQNLKLEENPFGVQN